jgi:5-formyltetrahydrofolate cyclo-ligase
MDGSDDKAALRRLVRGRRDAMGERARADASALVVGHLRTQLAAHLGSTVMSYMAFGAELDLGDLHDMILAAGGRLIVPRVSGRLIEPVEFRPGIDVLVSRFGITEPVGEPIDSLAIDVVLVPAVCFDRRGHRIGYGAGYYDRFLTLTRTDCRRIGVAFADQMVDRVPEESHDQPVEMVVTNEEVMVVGDS